MTVQELPAYAPAKDARNLVASIGIALGGILGMAGTVVSSQNVRAIFWAIDSVGLIVATSLLALRYFRKGADLVAAGFLVYAIGEAVMLSGTAASLEGSVPAFAAGTALWSAALLLTAIPRQFALWIRVASMVGAILFAITSARIFLGEQILPTAAPLPSAGYPFLVAAFAGWIWTIRKAEA